MTETKHKGNAGEETVCNYLKNKGYIIAARNYRTRGGEVDIIAMNRTTVAFVEVKLRRRSEFSAPREAVDEYKQQKLSLAASEYMQSTQCILSPRFDVAEVISDGGIEINYIENAFALEDTLWI